MRAERGPVSLPRGFGDGEFSRGEGDRTRPKMDAKEKRDGRLPRDSSRDPLLEAVVV